MIQDVRYACRSLLRSPGFSALVVVTLAVGIGATLTMFSLMQSVLWRPLPYPEPERIVTVQVEARNVPNAGALDGEVHDLRERSRSLEQVSTLDSSDVKIEYDGATEHVSALHVSDEFLPLLGVRTVVGRTLNSRTDWGEKQAFAVLISDDLWRRRFSADPHAVGRTVRINDAPVRIAGVLPPGLRMFLPPSAQTTEQIDVWFPLAMRAAREYRGHPILARLKRGVTIEEANGELQTLVAQFAREHPEAYTGGKVQFTARSLHDEITREARPALFLLLGAVLFVLLIACVNVANLMLARGSARERELEIRQALGARRVHVIRQLLAESMVLAVISAVLGLFCASLGLEAIGGLSTSHIPLQSRIGMDATVAFVALALSVVTSLMFGLLPAWRLAAGKVSRRLRAGRTETAGSGTRRLQRTLVVAEVALCVAPLACGGLMLRSFMNLMQSPLGFDPTNVVTAKARIDLKRYPQTEQRWAVLQDLTERVRALPGVESVSAASPLPLAGQATRRVGRADATDAPPILATQQIAAPGYLRVVGTPLRQGRDFTAADTTGRRDVAIVDERLAKRLWPEGALGKRLAIHRTGWRQELEVVGVTAAVRVTRVRDENVPHFMMPYHLYPIDMSLVVKTSATAELVGRGIEGAAEAAHTGWPAVDIRPMSAYVADSIGDTRFLMSVLAVFAAASVLLAAVGLYGTLAYLTAQRTREFGIRLALGSSVRSIVGIVVRESVVLAGAGAVLGSIGVMAVTGSMRQLLYRVAPLDPVTLGAVAALVGLVALTAASVPAWRVTRIDPQSSLRSE